MTRKKLEREMILSGATEEEAKRACDLFFMLQPGLKLKRNGKIDTIQGDKTPLGLYRTIYSENY